MAETEVLSIRMPAILKARVRAEADKQGVKLAEFIAEACRMRLDGSVAQSAERPAHNRNGVGSIPTIPTIAGSSNGRTVGFDPANGGSSPPPASKHPQVFYDSQGVTIVEGNVSTWTRNTCGKTWWEDGEQWECLMDKGHKESKHGMRGMFRRVEA